MNGLEHGPSLAGKSSHLVSSLQRSKDKKAFRGRASGRRDQDDRPGQAAADLGLRRAGRLADKFDTTNTIAVLLEAGRGVVGSDELPTLVADVGV